MKIETSMSLNPSLSYDLLNIFRGKRVSQLVRYSWWPKENVASECDICDELAFSLTAGPLAVIFENGDVLGIASEPSLNSVILWLDQCKDGKVERNSSLDKDIELFPISCNDNIYANSFWKQFIGLTLLDFAILKKRSMNALQRELPSEVGLSFIFEGNIKFIASHGLHDGTDDFSVLEYNQINPSIAEDLEETSVVFE